MNEDLDIRARWLCQAVLPHEAEVRAWLHRHRRVGGLDGDDVLQEAYSRLMSLESVGQIRNPRTYMFQTAASVVADHVRRARIVPIGAMPSPDMLNEADASPSPERSAIARDELQRLADAIERLSPKTRAVFSLRRIEGLSQREVAARLGLAESTVEKHMSRAFLRMLDLLRRGGKAVPRASREWVDQEHREHGAERERD